MTFTRWIDTFLTEKNVNLDKMIEVEGPSGLNMMPLSIVVDAMKASTGDHAALKAAMVRLDFANAPIVPFLEHCAGAIAR